MTLQKTILLRIFLADGFPPLEFEVRDFSHAYGILNLFPEGSRFGFRTVSVI